MKMKLVSTGVVCSQVKTTPSGTSFADFIGIAFRPLVRSKPTAYGRATLVGSAGPAISVLW